MKIIIAGATSSIGQFLIPALAEKYAVIALGRDAEKLATVPRHANVETLAVDYFAEEFPRLGEMLDARERLLFFNLCAATANNLFINTPVDAFRHAFEANVLTSVNLLRFLIPRMIAARWGRIIFAGSIAVPGHPGIAAYSAAKSALSGMSNTLAREYGRFGVTSNVLQLGSFADTSLWLNVPAHERNKLVRETAVRREGRVEEIIPVIDALAQSGYINGSVVTIDGGM